MEKQYVYTFGLNEANGGKDWRNLLGGKGANLAEMSKLNLPIPPGFTISTETCDFFYKSGQVINDELKAEIKKSLLKIEKKTGKEYGSADNPLLLSVRSGARVSMPGMMDTVLNLGLNAKTVEGISKRTKNEVFAWDSYRRFIQMYGDVVLGVSSSLFEVILDDIKTSKHIKSDQELTLEDLKNVVQSFKDIIFEEKGELFPEDPWEQLWKSIESVFLSWNNSRAHKYRMLHGYSDSWGTAVNIQSMVFGNMGNDSATGVAFSRNPSSGEKVHFGEYLINAQGEDVVAGSRTPNAINDSSKNDSNKDMPTLKEVMPKIYSELDDVLQLLENHFKDVQDVEFTIEQGKLYLLQTRNAKRNVSAAIKMAVDMVEENLVSEEEALLRVSSEELNNLLHPKIDPDAEKELLGKGLPASPGAASGKIYFTSEDVELAHSQKSECLLVRLETSPEDISGMSLSKGILTARGGMTSHAAVVARGMGKPCVSGCQSLVVDEKKKEIEIEGHVFKEGDYLTIDGSSGEIFSGKVRTADHGVSDYYRKFMSWADKVRTKKVRVNAETIPEVKKALDFGAEGIGLCRTEHMFFDPERLFLVRQMIMSDKSDVVQEVLRNIEELQQNDFENIFELMDGKPVNIRLLDPPLHEFLPKTEKEKSEFSEAANMRVEDLNEKIKNMYEYNPMLGHRGVRLGVTFPDVYQMQARAIIKGAIDWHKKGGSVFPEIMIPLVFDEKEYKLVASMIKSEIENTLENEKVSFQYKIGTMIELPRACLVAGSIAKEAEFFSFGTNDLTQTTFGISRDDSPKFMFEYIQNNIVENDPFIELDKSGVGRLVEIAVKEGREANKNLHIGLCGEHGGNPQSLKYLSEVNLDYVSCSPFRIPLARLALAQENIKKSKV